MYRFDCYQPTDWLSWKKNVNGMPDFGIDYERTKAVNIAELKNVNKGTYKIPVRYYPGIDIEIPLPRSPVQPILNYFLPAILVSGFSLAANNVGDKDNVMETVGIALLTYVQLYQQIRGVIPNTRSVTIMEWVLIIYMIYSIIPLFDIGFAFDALKGRNSVYMFIVINVVLATFMIIKMISQLGKSRDRDPTAKVKAKAERKSPDSSWGPPKHPKSS